MLRRIVSIIMLFSSLAGLAAGDPTVNAQPNSTLPSQIPPAAPQAPAGLYVDYEVEPNNAYTTATPFFGNSVAIQGDILLSGDVDFFSFAAVAGQRVFAAVMTDFGPDDDSWLELIGTNGSTVLESDDENGTIGSRASSIAGAPIFSTGTYYLKVRNFDGDPLHQYVLHVILTTGSADPEIASNNTTGTAQPLANDAWIAGSRSDMSDVDYYSVSLAAGDTIFASLDLDPARTGEWNGRLGFGIFGGEYLIADDPGAAGSDSEALMATVKTAGTYYLFVDALGTDNGSYQLTLHITEEYDVGLGCLDFASEDVPVVIGSGGPGVITSTLNIPVNFPNVLPIYDLDVNILLNHTFARDLDVLLVSPQGNTNVLFTDVGDLYSGVSKTVDIRLDDEAASPIDAFIQLQNRVVQPQGEYRLDLFDGEPAAGDWSLVIYDDTTLDGGNLLNWSLTVCFALPLLICPTGTATEDVFVANFESGPEGFTHSGTQDEWEWGLPTAAPLAGCFDGSAGCWATDLDSRYNSDSSQDLYSPMISLADNLEAGLVIWWQKYQLDSAAADQAYVDVLPDIGPPARAWEWRGPIMIANVGSGDTLINESSGWGLHIADLSAYIGQEIQLRFHLESGPGGQYDGLAIDNVRVFACHATPVYIPVVTR